MNYWGFSITSAVVSLLFIYWHLVADARCDNIMFKRTAAGTHPYRDYWHLQKTIRRFAMFGAGVFFCLQFVFGLQADVRVLLIVLPILQVFIILIFFMKKWNAIAFEKSDKYLDKDESLKLSTGIHWLDKWLGLHY